VGLPYTARADAPITSAAHAAHQAPHGARTLPSPHEALEGNLAPANAVPMPPAAVQSSGLPWGVLGVLLSTLALVGRYAYLRWGVAAADWCSAQRDAEMRRAETRPLTALEENEPFASATQADAVVMPEPRQFQEDTYEGQQSGTGSQRAQGMALLVENWEARTTTSAADELSMAPHQRPLI